MGLPIPMQITAHPSAALDKSSLAATMYLYPLFLRISIMSMYTFENNVAGAETVSGISTLLVDWIWHS
jgi:hypothetical protein